MIESKPLIERLRDEATEWAAGDPCYLGLRREAAEEITELRRDLAREANARVVLLAEIEAGKTRIAELERAKPKAAHVENCMCEACWRASSPPPDAPATESLWTCDECAGPPRPYSEIERCPHANLCWLRASHDRSNCLRGAHRLREMV